MISAGGTPDLPALTSFCDICHYFFEKSLELLLYAVDPTGQTFLQVAMGCTLP
jgi:hypothetical protein